MSFLRIIIAILSLMVAVPLGVPAASAGRRLLMSPRAKPSRPDVVIQNVTVPYWVFVGVSAAGALSFATLSFYLLFPPKPGNWQSRFDS